MRDGPFLTASSAYAQLDLTLALIADTMGTSVAHLCSRYMIQSHSQHVDPTVIAAERWIDAHLSSPISITEPRLRKECDRSRLQRINIPKHVVHPAFINQLRRRLSLKFSQRLSHPCTRGVVAPCHFLHPVHDRVIRLGLARLRLEPCHKRFDTLR